MDWSPWPQRNVWISWKVAVWPTHFVAAAASSARWSPAARQAHPATRGQGLIPGRPEIGACHQFGRADTVDWLSGRAAGVQHAKPGWQLHVAAGGSYGAPIHASADHGPTPEQYERPVAPICAGRGGARPPVCGGPRELQDRRLGPAARPRCLLEATRPGFAESSTHPSAHLHQGAIDK
jgi:hypothetical protein